MMNPVGGAKSFGVVATLADLVVEFVQPARGKKVPGPRTHRQLLDVGHREPLGNLFSLDDERLAGAEVASFGKGAREGVACLGEHDRISGAGGEVVRFGAPLQAQVERFRRVDGVEGMRQRVREGRVILRLAGQRDRFFGNGAPPREGIGDGGKHAE